MNDKNNRMILIDKQVEDKSSDTYDYYDYDEETDEYTYAFSVDLFRILSLLMSFEDVKGHVLDAECYAANYNKKNQH